MTTPKHRNSLFLDLQYDYTWNLLPSPVSTFWISRIVILHMYCIDITWSLVLNSPFFPSFLCLLACFPLKAKTCSCVEFPPPFSPAALQGSLLKLHASSPATRRRGSSDRRRL